MSSNGTLVRTRAGEISVLGRNTQGVRLIRLDEGERLIGVERVEPETGDVEDESAATSSRRPTPDRRRPPAADVIRARGRVGTARPGLLHCAATSSGESTAMSRVFNFSAGPAALPAEVLEQLRDEMLDWHGQGMSVMEMSHRGKAFVGIAEQAEADLRELLAVPANYKVLFLQGGATAQFAAIPLNLTRPDVGRRLRQHRRLVEEGHRRGEALLQGQRRRRRGGGELLDGAGAVRAGSLTPGAAYLHYTPNETIGGVEFPFIPDVGDVPLVADMSSTILSRPIDVSAASA